jgi:serine protease SohB
LVDEIQTSDDYILAKAKEYKVFEISFEEKQSLSEKLGFQFANIVEKIFTKLVFQFRR